MRAMLVVIMLAVTSCAPPSTAHTCQVREFPPAAGPVVGLPNGPQTVKSRNLPPWIPNQYVPAPALTRCS